MTKLPDNLRLQLLDIAKSRFDISELKEISWVLTDNDQINNSTSIPIYARELIEHAERRDEVDCLILKMFVDRPSKEFAFLVQQIHEEISKCRRHEIVRITLKNLNDKKGNGELDDANDLVAIAEIVNLYEPLAKFVIGNNSSTASLKKRPYVLIVENNSDWQDRIKSAIKRSSYSHYHLQFAGSSLQAAEMVKNLAGQLALAIIDLRLNDPLDEKEDGYDLIELLQPKQISSEPPCIILSGHLEQNLIKFIHLRNHSQSPPIRALQKKDFIYSFINVLGDFLEAKD